MTFVKEPSDASLQRTSLDTWEKYACREEPVAASAGLPVARSWQGQAQRS
jgi:hypothetical protein